MNKTDRDSVSSNGGNSHFHHCNRWMWRGCVVLVRSLMSLKQGTLSHSWLKLVKVFDLLAMAGGRGRETRLARVLALFYLDHHSLFC